MRINFNRSRFMRLQSILNDDYFCLFQTLSLSSLKEIRIIPHLKYMFRIVGKYRCLCARCAAPKSTLTIVDNGYALPLLKNDSTFATYIKFYFYKKKRKKKRKIVYVGFKIDLRKKRHTYYSFSLFYSHPRTLPYSPYSIYLLLSIWI